VRPAQRSRQCFDRARRLDHRPFTVNGKLALTVWPSTDSTL
jgi:hypothetical protein